jgi:hypothetical protein
MNTYTAQRKGYLRVNTSQLSLLNKNKHWSALLYFKNLSYTTLDVTVIRKERFYGNVTKQSKSLPSYRVREAFCLTLSWCVDVEVQAVLTLVA